MPSMWRMILSRYLRPTYIARRLFITRGIFGGSRGWLAVGGSVWFSRWLKGFLGRGEPHARYTADVSRGERVILVHEPLSPAAAKKAARRARKEERRAG